MIQDSALSNKETRRRLGNIGHTKLYELYAAGKLKARKLAGRTVVLESDLAHYLAMLPDAVEAGTIRSGPGRRQKTADPVHVSP